MRTLTRHQAFSQEATLVTTPGCSSATIVASAEAALRSGRTSVLFFDQGATSAVRLPESRLCSTQPSAPSEIAHAPPGLEFAVISTGKPVR